MTTNFNPNLLDPRNNPFLREIVGVLPHTAMVLECDEVDEDGWEIFHTFRVGDLLTKSGNLFRLVGFVADEQYGRDEVGLILKPHGLGHDQIIHSIICKPSLSLVVQESEVFTRHQDGLVYFG